jgi:epidermal growth factor receptor substrate 15
MFYIKQMLMNSKLPVDVLGNIWELSDVDKDGFLDRDEFFVVIVLYIYFQLF